jgi:hypothetical protein
MCIIIRLSSELISLYIDSLLARHENYKRRAGIIINNS